MARRACLGSRQAWVETMPFVQLLTSALSISNLWGLWVRAERQKEDCDFQLWLTRTQASTLFLSKCLSLVLIASPRCVGDLQRAKHLEAVSLTPVTLCGTAYSTRGPALWTLTFKVLSQAKRTNQVIGLGTGPVAS